MGAEKEKKIDAKFKNEKCCVTPDSVVVVVVAVDRAAADTGLGTTGALTQGLLLTCTVQYSTVKYRGSSSPMLEKREQAPAASVLVQATHSASSCNVLYANASSILCM